MRCVCVQVWIEFGRIKLPQGFHPNDLEEEWGKLILEMLEREKALRPAVERLVHAHIGHVLQLVFQSRNDSEHFTHISLKAPQVHHPV